MKILDQNLKAKIVQESYKEGATVASLAKKYGVSTSAIDRWRQSSSSEEKIEGKEVEDKFIKAPIQKSRVIAKLKKAELCKILEDQGIQAPTPPLESFSKKELVAMLKKLLGMN